MGSFLEEDFQNPPPAFREPPYGQLLDGYEASSEETDDEDPCDNIMEGQVKGGGGLYTPQTTLFLPDLLSRRLRPYAPKIPPLLFA